MKVQGGPADRQAAAQGQAVGPCSARLLSLLCHAGGQATGLVGAAHQCERLKASSSKTCCARGTWECQPGLVQEELGSSGPACTAT